MAPVMVETPMAQFRFRQFLPQLNYLPFDHTLNTWKEAMASFYFLGETLLQDISLTL